MKNISCICLYNFKKFEVFVDTDCDKIINDCMKDKYLKHVFCYERNQKFIDIEKSKTLSPAPLLIKNFLDNYVEKKKRSGNYISCYITFFKNQNFRISFKKNEIL